LNDSSPNDVYFSEESDDNFDDDNDDENIHLDCSNDENVNQQPEIEPIHNSTPSRPCDREYVLQENFKSNTCGCTRLFNGKPCSEAIEWEKVINYRLSCLEKSKEELDLLIKVQLFHHRKTPDSKSSGNVRQRPHQTYFFAGFAVCRTFFAFVHGLHRKTIDSIAKSLDTDFLVPRTHGNKGMVPHNAVTLEQTQAVKHFIVTYGSQYGLPLPGRLPNYRSEKNVVLPSD
jgi:hypothetical protein